MGYEWRVFFPIQPSAKTPDVWRILGTKAPLFTEKRVDKYIACTEDVGVKLRGSHKVLEVKVRLSVDAQGIEYWEKIARTCLDSPGDMKETIAQLLESLAGKFAEHRPSLLRAAKLLRAAPKIRMFALSKSRKRDKCHGVDVEQTDIDLLPEESSDRTEVLVPTSGQVKEGNTAELKEPTGAVMVEGKDCSKYSHWRSVSLENKKAAKVSSLLSRIGAMEGSPLPSVFKEFTSSPMGYPEFVLSL